MLFFLVGPIVVCLFGILVVILKTFMFVGEVLRGKWDVELVKSFYYIKDPYMNLLFY